MHEDESVRCMRLAALALEAWRCSTTRRQRHREAEESDGDVER
jgi:hypothetical protein